MSLQAIKDWFGDLLSEGSSVSAMRVMAFTSLFTGCFIGIFGVVNKSDLGNITMLASVFVGAAFGGKVLQKTTEIKVQQNPNEGA